MKFTKPLLVVMMATIVCGGLAAEARAGAFLFSGNVPQTDENVLLNTGAIGNPIFGATSGTGLVVEFWSIEDLRAPSNGQARVEGADGLFTELGVRIPSGSFASLILNLDATATGTVEFTATASDGVYVFSNWAVGGSGSNFFTLTTDLGTRFLDVYLKADVPIAFTDAAQVRIGGARAETTDDVPQNNVPEPASLLLFGAALAGAGWRLRRQVPTRG